MPQIVCSHHAADPCSAVIGDRALLSAAQGVCVCHHTCVCQEDVHSIYVCVGVFVVHVRVWCVCDGSINSSIRQCCCLLHCLSVFVRFPFMGQTPLSKVKHSKHPLDK